MVRKYIFLEDLCGLLLHHYNFPLGIDKAGHSVAPWSVLSPHRKEVSSSYYGQEYWSFVCLFHALQFPPTVQKHAYLG